MNETNKLYLKSLIENNDWKSLKRELNQLSPLEIAELIDEISKSDGIVLFRLLSREYAKETFENLSHESQQDIIEGLAKNVTKITSLLNDLEPDDRTAFFEDLPGEVVQPLMQLLSDDERKIAGQLLAYPEDSVGRLMTPEYVAVKAYFTVTQALEHIRKYGRNSETLNIIYVVDDRWNLVDDIRIKDLIFASPDDKISDISDNKFIALNVFDDQEQAVKVFLDQDRVALPVVDNEGTLLGIVTFDDMMDVAEEESTEDFHKFGSIRDAIVNPLKATISTLYKNRVVWLTTLVFVNVFSGAAIASFEDLIQSAVSLVFFLPLLIGSGGNAGSQSATLMIRSLATGDVEMKDWFKLLGKELLVSFLLGLTMAAGVAIIAAFRAPEIIIVVSTTMVLTVIAGSLIGLILPFIFTKFKVDPATASAPLITSISDILGVVIYFSIARVMLGI